MSISNEDIDEWLTEDEQKLWGLLAGMEDWSAAMTAERVLVASIHRRRYVPARISPADLGMTRFGLPSGPYANGGAA